MDFITKAKSISSKKMNCSQLHISSKLRKANEMQDCGTSEFPSTAAGRTKGISRTQLIHLQQAAMG